MIEDGGDKYTDYWYLERLRKEGQLAELRKQAWEKARAEQKAMLRELMEEIEKDKADEWATQRVEDWKRRHGFR